MSIPELRSPAARIRAYSSLSSLQLIQQLPDLRQFISRGFLGRQRTHHKLRRRAAEGFFQQIVDQLLLSLLLRKPCLIDMCSLRLVPLDQSLLGHDLHQFEHGRVTCFAVTAEYFMHLPDSTRPAAPEHSQYSQLRICRSRWVRIAHFQSPYCFQSSGMFVDLTYTRRLS